MSIAVMGTTTIRSEKGGYRSITNESVEIQLIKLLLRFLESQINNFGLSLTVHMDML